MRSGPGVGHIQPVDVQMVTGTLSWYKARQGGASSCVFLGAWVQCVCPVQRPLANALDGNSKAGFCIPRPSDVGMFTARSVAKWVLHAQHVNPD